MVSPKLTANGGKRTVMRELSEYAAKLASEIGKDNVFDFSLGNPSTDPPQEVTDAIIDIVKTSVPAELHGYSSNAGLDSCRQAIAESFNRRFGCSLTKNNFIMVTGASTGLHIISTALNISPESEIMVIAPFFPGYHAAVSMGGNKLVAVPPDTEHFQINFEALEERISPNTQGIIINSPNNPSGTVYNKETIIRLADILKKKSAEYGHAIYIICDEPYRELVYSDIEVPYVPKYYNNTIICYSYSKSLSLPGERIGFIATDNDIDDFDTVWMALRAACPIVANVCAPTLFQRVIERCVDVKPNLADYVYNRNLLLERFGEIGYNFASPDGAFYLFFEAPFGISALQFSEICKAYNIIVVPTESFGCPGWLRLSFCVSRSKVERSLDGFARAYEDAKALAGK